MQTESREIKVAVGQDIFVYGDLNLPDDPHALVIFSHGSGSSRFSARNRQVAQYLVNKRIATLLTDLLTTEEDSVYENRFDIELLTERLVAVTRYAARLPEMKDLPIGYFGASTGAASALKASARFGHGIRAVVSRGGRPDLAKEALHAVKSATLLVVGSLDIEVIDLNRQAYALMNCEKKMEIVEGASHLFEEQGKLEEVAGLSAEWFNTWLKAPVIINGASHNQH